MSLVEEVLNEDSFSISEDDEIFRCFWLYKEYLALYEPFSVVKREQGPLHDNFQSCKQLAG